MNIIYIKNTLNFQILLNKKCDSSLKFKNNLFLFLFYFINIIHLEVQLEKKKVSHLDINCFRKYINAKNRILSC